MLVECVFSPRSLLKKWVETKLKVIGPLGLSVWSLKKKKRKCFFNLAIIAPRKEKIQRKKIPWLFFLAFFYYDLNNSRQSAQCVKWKKKKNIRMVSDDFIFETQLSESGTFPSSVRTNGMWILFWIHYWELSWIYGCFSQPGLWWRKS